MISAHTEASVCGPRLAVDSPNWGIRRTVLVQLRTSTVSAKEVRICSQIFPKDTENSKLSLREAS